MLPSPTSLLEEITAHVRALNGAEREVLEANLEEQRIPRSGVILERGAYCRSAAFIAEGLVRYTNLQEDGALTTCYFAWEGGFAFDPDSYTMHTPTRLGIEAVTDVRLQTLSPGREQLVLKVMPDWESIGARLAQRFYNELLDQRAFLLNRSAAEKHEHLLRHYPGIALRAPQGQIASFLGITPQSLSRLRAGG